MKKILTLYFVLGSIIAGNTQINLDKRKEFDLRGDEDIVATYTIGKKGLITLGVEAVKGGNDNYIITKYDTGLEKTFNVSFEKESRVKQVGFYPNQDTTELVCLFENKKEWIIKYLDLATFDLSERRFAKMDWMFGRVESVGNVVDGRIYFRGVRKKRPHVLILNIENGQEKEVEIPGINAKRVIESYTMDKNFENVVIFMRDGRDLKKSAMNLLIMDLDGNFSTPMVLDKNPEYSIIDGKITWINKTSFVLAGTYGLGSRSIAASGYYMSKWTDGEQEFITYHSFTDFENFFKYLPQRTQKRMEKKKQRKSNKGATDFIKTRIALHPVIIADNVYRIVGEVYYPTYRTETYTTMGANGRMTTSTRQVFDGYQYSHAAILDLDDSGQKIKDYCFTMFLLYKPYRVVLNLKIQQEPKGDMHFIYSDGGSIRAATITASGELTETDFGTVETGVEGDKVRTGYSRSVYWYDNVFLLYGVQKIKNKERDDVAKKRTVFFINKISYNASW